MAGGRVGNTEGTEDNQSGSESNAEMEGCVWDARELEGTAGACGVLVGGLKSKSLSKVTHRRVGGGGWRRGARPGGREEAGARGKEGAGDGAGGNRGACAGGNADDGPNGDELLWSWKAGAAVGAGAGVRMSGGVKADAGRWALKSGVSERCRCCGSGPVKGLVLLGRAGSGSGGRGQGEACSVSCERLRDWTGGGGSREEEEEEEEANSDGVADDDDDESTDRAEGCRGKDGGRALEDAHVNAGTEGGARREEPLVRDWVLCQEDDEEEEEEEGNSEAGVSKVPGIHCASPWIPFSPLV